MSAGPAVSLSREYEIGNIPVNVSAHISANLNGAGDLGLFIPSYVFATPVLGGQAAASLMGIYGNTRNSLTGTVTGTVGGIPFGPRFDSISGSATGFGDLYPLFTLRWNNGVNNYMAYVTGDVPVGDYNSASLANIGIGHGAVNSGGGYTSRSGSSCESPAMRNGRCRMHGGTSTGAPKGNKNAFKHGRYTAEAVRRRREVSVLIRMARRLCISA